MSTLAIGIACLVIWLSILSVIVFRLSSHYNRLTLGVSTHSLREALDKILEAYIKNKKEIAVLSQKITNLELQSQTHFQKIGIVRFNPFSDTGGSQSFTMALLDKADNGVIMTSLYARTGNRWYIKYIKAGAGHEVELSKEEKLAIKDAK